MGLARTPLHSDAGLRSGQKDQLLRVVSCSTARHYNLQMIDAAMATDAIVPLCRLVQLWMLEASLSMPEGLG